MILFYDSTSLPRHCMSNVVQLQHCGIAQEQSSLWVYNIYMAPCIYF